jgi:hypothetical protein
MLDFDFLGVRTVSNATDLRYNPRKWFGVYAGYTFSDRQIRVEEAFNLPGVPNGSGSSLYPQESTLSAVSGGFRLQPLKPWTVNLEGEVGHASGALTPVSDRNYHTIGGRTQYRTKLLQLGATYRELYNENAPLSFTTYSSRSRQAGASASWASIDGSRWIPVTRSYTWTPWVACSSSRGWSPRSLQTGYDSIFISNIHAANLGARFSIGRRADLFVGYTITKDTGDGRSTAAPSGTTGTSRPCSTRCRLFR